MALVPAFVAQRLAAASQADSQRPNVLVILADDLGYADLGVYGCKDVATPHLDSIARAGVRFTNGYATHSVCAPSRAGLLSGRYQQRFGFEYNPGSLHSASANFGLPSNVPTLAETLKAAGYVTGMVGKWHLGYREGLRPHERGFDHVYGFLGGARNYTSAGRSLDPLYRDGREVPEEPEYLTQAFAREAVAFLEAHRQETFFLYLAFNAVHRPLEATEKDLERSKDIEDDKRRTMAAMLLSMDDAVGRVLDTLRRLELEENTLVLFYSDNGGPTASNASRNDPLRGFKGDVFEGGIRVPFLVQWKGKLPAGVIYDFPVMGFDVHATALAAAGVVASPEPPLVGKDLVPYLTGRKSERPHENLFWRSGPLHAARVGDWKLVATPGESDALYDLNADIGETQDLAAEHPETLAKLQAIYAEWDGRMHAPLWTR